MLNFEFEVIVNLRTYVHKRTSFGQFVFQTGQPPAFPVKDWNAPTLPNSYAFVRPILLQGRSYRPEILDHSGVCGPGL